MSVKDLYDAALSLLSEHNEAIGETDGELLPGQVDPDKVIGCIKAAGGTSEDRLKRFRYEEILACLPETEGVKPVALARDLADIFRGKESTNSDTERRPISSKKAERMTPRELVENFDPEEPDSPIGRRLSKQAQGEPFVIFSNGRDVDVDSTLTLFKEVKGGRYDGRETYEVNGEIKKVYRVGELPDDFAEENPLYEDVPLRPDGTCDQTGRSWESVRLEVRQMVRVAIDEGELTISDIDKAHDVINIAIKSNALKELQQRYRHSAVKFKELQSTGELPKLKIPLGRIDQKGEAKATAPFSDGKKVEWYAPPPNAAYNAYMSSNRRGDYTESWAKHMARKGKRK